MKHFLFTGVFLSIIACNSKLPDLDNVDQLIMRGAIDSAKVEIDRYLFQEQLAYEVKSFYYKGFIYKEHYQLYEKEEHVSLLREESLAAFGKYLELIPEEEISMRSKTEDQVRFLLSETYRDAIKQLNPQDYEAAEVNFDTYLKWLHLIRPDTNMQMIEHQFRMAEANVFMGVYKEDTVANRSFFKKTERGYQSAIALCPDHVEGYYSLARLYYNAAVNKITTLAPCDSDSSLARNNGDRIYSTQQLIQCYLKLNNTADEVLILFRKSRPYFEKVLSIDPEHASSIIGLQGVNYATKQSDTILKKGM